MVGDEVVDFVRDLAKESRCLRSLLWRDCREQLGEMLVAREPARDFAAVTLGDAFPIRGSVRVFTGLGVRLVLFASPTDGCPTRLP